MQSLFPQSMADGDGYNANIQQQRRNSGELDADKMTLMHSSDTKSTQSDTEVQLDSHIFSKGDFVEDEQAFVVISAIVNGTGGTLKLRAADSIGSVDMTLDLTAGFNHIYMLNLFSSIDKTNIQAIGHLVSAQAGSTVDRLFTNLDLSDTDIMTTAWQLSIRGYTDASSNSLTVRWWIYRRGH